MVKYNKLLLTDEQAEFIKGNLLNILPDMIKDSTHKKSVSIYANKKQLMALYNKLQQL